MNWSIVLLLSLFGLAMGFGTVFVIPSSVEPVFWLVVFLVSAYVVARNCTQRLFLHGLAIGVANSVWITATHILLFQQYLERHPKEMAMMKSMPLPDSPRLMMALTGPVVGIITGIIIGLLCLLAGKLLGRSAREGSASA